MNSASGTCGSITKDVTFVSLEFWKEQNKGRVGKVLKKNKNKKNTRKRNSCIFPKFGKRHRPQIQEAE